MDDLETDYWGELMPYEEWESFDKRQITYVETELTNVVGMIYDYYIEQEEIN